MRLLLDTHTLIWWWLEDAKLSRKAHAAIVGDNEIFVSPVSAFEIALKVRTGKLPTMIEPLDQFADATSGDGMAHIPVHHEHAKRAGLLAGNRRDPFDRLIAAQGLIEDMTIITRDAEFAAFGCKTLW